jgi:hypothetical protein
LFWERWRSGGDDQILVWYAWISFKAFFFLAQTWFKRVSEVIKVRGVGHTKSWRFWRALKILCLHGKYKIFEFRFAYIRSENNQLGFLDSEAIHA